MANVGEPPPNDGFTLVSRHKRQRISSSSPIADTSVKSKHPIQPILLSNILSTAIKNSIKLAGLIKKAKPTAKIDNIKIVNNTTILIFPANEHSANILLKPWETTPDIGSPKPKLPQGKQEPQFLAVICGVNPEISDGEIKTELEDFGFATKFVKRLISNATKKATWKVKLGLCHEDDLKEVIESGVILGYTKHRVELYRELPVILQCYKCQAFGHKYQDCKNEFKCLRCGGNHNHKNCIKPKEEKKCVNCGGDHVALYKGCPAFKEARVELANLNSESKTKSYAQAAAAPVTVTTKLEKVEKINFILYTTELVKAALKKCGLEVSTSDMANYAATLALIFLNVKVSGEEIFELLKSPPSVEKVVEMAKKPND